VLAEPRKTAGADLAWHVQGYGLRPEALTEGRSKTLTEGRASVVQTTAQRTSYGWQSGGRGAGGKEQTEGTGADMRETKQFKNSKYLFRGLNLNYV